MNKKIPLLFLEFIIVILITGCYSQKILYNLPEYEDHSFESDSVSDKYKLQSTFLRTFTLTQGSNKYSFVYKSGFDHNKGFQIQGVFDKNTLIRNDKLTNNQSGKSYRIQGTIKSRKLLNTVELANPDILTIKIVDSLTQKESGNYIREYKYGSTVTREIFGKKINVPTFLVTYIGEINQKATSISITNLPGESKEENTEIGRIWSYYPEGSLIYITDDKGIAVKIAEGQNINKSKLFGIQSFSGVYSEIYFRKNIDDAYKADLLAIYLISLEFKGFEYTEDDKK